MYKYKFKLIVLGDSGVGKSTMMYRLKNDKFWDDPVATIGIEYLQQTTKVNDDNIMLQIWDTAGQESYRSIVKSYFRSASGAILCYDITDMMSFYHIDEWIKEIDHKIPMLLLGMKLDNKAKRQVATDQAEAYAKKNKMLFFEVSNRNRYEQNYNSKKILELSINKLAEAIYHGIPGIPEDELMEHGIVCVNQIVPPIKNSNQYTYHDQCGCQIK